LNRNRSLLVLLVLVIATGLLLPSAAMAGPKAGKHLNADGSIPPEFNLPKPKAVKHADVLPSTAGGVGDGSNSIHFGAFETGDMCVTQGTATGHAGLWDDARHGLSDSNFCVWSANTEPVNSVQLERPTKYRTYDWACGIWVPLEYGHRFAVKDWCAAQRGKPYSLTASKTDYRTFYCSKLCWAGYKVKAGVDLDHDLGFYVWPIDLVNDWDTAIFTSSW
jgi:hypothetical protein